MHEKVAIEIWIIAPRTLKPFPSSCAWLAWLCDSLQLHYTMCRAFSPEHTTQHSRLAGAREYRVRESADPSKIWSWGQKSHMAHIFVLCLNKCIYNFPSRSPVPLYCIKNQHDFKGWGENQRIMLHEKLDFWPWAPCWKKWFPSVY